VAFALFLSSLMAGTVVAGDPRPVFHGFLDVSPVRGRITNLDQLTANLDVRGWLFLPTPESNGVFPEREDVVIALGENKFTVPSGAVQANGKATRFSYRAQMRPGESGIRSVRIVRKPDNGPLAGWYAVQFKLRGLDLRELYDQDPVCLSMAFIVGDDDGFSGIELTRKTFQSRRFRVRGACDSNNSWPWL
jgi:hypothetical protein